MGPLFSPCKCRGSLGKVHAECLSMWRRLLHCVLSIPFKLLLSLLHFQNEQQSTIFCSMRLVPLQVFLFFQIFYLLFASHPCTMLLRGLVRYNVKRTKLAHILTSLFAAEVRAIFHALLSIHHYLEFLSFNLSFQTCDIKSH